MKHSYRVVADGHLWRVLYRDEGSMLNGNQHYVRTPSGQKRRWMTRAAAEAFAAYKNAGGGNCLRQDEMNGMSSLNEESHAHH